MGSSAIQKDGKNLKIFGFSLPINPLYADMLSGAIQPAQAWITDKSAGVIRTNVKSLVQSITKSDVKGGKAGNIAEGLWRFGFPLLDLTLGVARTAVTGRKELKTLSLQASTLLAANHGGKAGIGIVLGRHVPSALAYERSRVFKNARNGALSQFTKMFNVVPQWIIGYWKYQDNLMKDSAELYGTKRTGKRLSAAEIAKKEDSLFHRIGGENPKDSAQLYAEMYDYDTRSHSRSSTTTPDDYPYKPGEDGRDPRDARHLPFKLGNSEQNTKLNNLLHPDSYEKLGSYSKTAPGSLSPGFWLLTIGGILSSAMGEMIHSKTTKDESAWLKIVELDNFIKTTSSKSKSASYTDQVENKVKAIFVQHAKDMGIRPDNLPDGDEADETYKAWAKAIVEEGAPVAAIAEFLDNKDAVVFDKDGVAFAGELATNAAIGQYIAKYSNSKAFFNQSPFTKEDAINALRNLPEEEKELFVWCFRPGVLEQALKESGASDEEIAEVSNLRDQGRDHFVADMRGAAKNLFEMNREELQGRGVPDQVIDKMEAMKLQLNKKKDAYIDQHISEIASLVLAVAMSAQEDKQGLWTTLVGKKSASYSAKAPEQSESYVDRVSKKEETKDKDDEKDDYDDVSKDDKDEDSPDLLDDTDEKEEKDKKEERSHAEKLAHTRRDPVRPAGRSDSRRPGDHSSRVHKSRDGDRANIPG